jgi:hypothetical protein
VDRNLDVVSPVSFRAERCRWVRTSGVSRIDDTMRPIHQPDSDPDDDHDSNRGRHPYTLGRRHWFRRHMRVGDCPRQPACTLLRQPSKVRNDL